MQNDNCGCKRLFLPGARNHAPQGNGKEGRGIYGSGR